MLKPLARQLDVDESCKHLHTMLVLRMVQEEANTRNNGFVPLKDVEWLAIVGSWASAVVLEAGIPAGIPARNTRKAWAE